MGVVTCSDHDLDVGILEQVQGFQHLILGIHKAGCGAQGQVGCIHFQADTVFQCCHDGCPAGAAALLEHLHDHQLCIGCNTDDVGALGLICSGNTGDVSTVVGTGVEIVYVGGAGAVVKDEGKLGVIVGSVEQGGHLTGVQLFPDLVDGLAGHGIHQHVFGQGAEAGMIHLDAGIQDGDAHALTGVAGLVGGVGADHGGGIVGVLLEVLLLRQVEGSSHIHLLDIFHALQSFLVAIGSGHGEAGSSHGVGEAQFEAVLVTEGSLHAVLHCGQDILLLLCMGLNRSSLVGDFADGEQLQLGLLINDDDEGHNIVCLGAVHSCGVREALPAGALELGQSGLFGSLLLLGFVLHDAGGLSEFILLCHIAVVGQGHRCKGSRGAAQDHSQYQNQC